MRYFIENVFTGVFIGIFMGGVLLLFGVGFLIYKERDTYWQKQAIERDFGEFCSRTGEWSWIGECEQ